ncbi:MAG: type I-E CRISPR-associated protein Cas6/Cse3/CasE [Rhodothermaceae bacterium]|nr:type I-E CRISPR-associated protein Cas6/Cse3/CasE [Rhodothermaceae bacterium]MXW31797.1 type I-E CRISPR-associated protein Cas6/Cse3/CasE [Rhodothermaceae bacterium]MYC05052.1 type I-E CRISPR-associated protein Cas6/Cse3/CasE [Rhodothermaceae bacterium]MYE62975.1 type I-E CRISPR-associated protein Cas6/Cse3/CasE [Rhodothermaceae bacterium]MYI16376.1 type I-E CRISPR-associated protein Cas6/Cse3/CasE [Rhodothermaceae bacterium]
MSLFLVNVPCDVRNLKLWGAKRRLIIKGIFDEGYALHKLLSETFGVRILQPFRFFSSSRGKQGSIYAYSNSGADELLNLAQTYALPEVFEILELEKLRSKQMPFQYEENQRLGFDIRLRPTRRSRLKFDTMSGNRSGGQLSRSEIDAYAWEHIHPGSNRQGSVSKQEITRESVYHKWLSDRLGPVASLQACSLHAFRRSKVIRGQSSLSEGPDAILHGTLNILDVRRFQGLLENGIGRHRAYGYGMILLRPPQ